MEEVIEAIEERIAMLKEYSVQLFKILNQTTEPAPKKIVENLITRTDNDVYFLQIILLKLHQPA